MGVRVCRMSRPVEDLAVENVIALGDARVPVHCLIAGESRIGRQATILRTKAQRQRLTVRLSIFRSRSRRCEPSSRGRHRASSQPNQDPVEDSGASTCR